MHDLVQARHRGHDGRPRLRHIQGKFVDATGVIDLRADADGKELAGGVFVRMGQGQEGQENLVIKPHLRQQLYGAGAIAQDRAMAQHDALGHAAGSRGVNQASGLIACQRGGVCNDAVRRAVMGGD